MLYKSATSPTYHPLHTLITPRNHHPTPSQSPIAVQTHDMSKDTIRNSTHSPPTAHPRHFKNPSRNPFTAPSQYKIMTRLTRIHVTHPSSLKKKNPPQSPLATPTLISTHNPLLSPTKQSQSQSRSHQQFHQIHHTRYITVEICSKICSKLCSNIRHLSRLSLSHLVPRRPGIPTAHAILSPLVDPRAALAEPGLLLMGVCRGRVCGGHGGFVTGKLAWCTEVVVWYCARRVSGAKVVFGVSWGDGFYIWYL